MRVRFPLLVSLALFVSTLVTNVAIEPASASATWPVKGIDVSKWQDVIAWDQVAASGVDFAIIKATEGTNRIDPMFFTNVAGASAQGVAVGMYHVATPVKDLTDARREADHFVNVAGPVAGNVIPALDIELSHVPSTMSPSTLESWTRAWLNRVTNTLGVRPMIYGSVTMFTDKLANTTWFADHGFPLWLARWGTLPSPLPANDWQGQGWTFWQWEVATAGTVPGITTAIDRDRYVGTDLINATIASVTAEPGAGGTITDSTGKVACLEMTICSALYSPGDSIQLTATPAPGYALVSWGGACASAASSTCTLTTLGSQTVTATFSYRLKVKVTGDMPGTVTSDPAGIDCPGTCAAPFAPGTPVTLTATTGRWSGVTWSGDCTGTDLNGCGVVMDQPRDVTATFADLGPATATIKAPGARSGPVRVSFDQPVHHVTRDNLLVRPAGGTKVAAKLTCYTLSGHRTDCATGRVGSAVLQPASVLRLGVRYVAIVDPAGVGPVRDGVGNATPLTKLAFTL
jgi:GH25 family lysozyme M1 (1,4-beta-N-acetylmuramidase)/Fe-S cluster biogenesis protein NfuA